MVFAQKETKKRYAIPSILQRQISGGDLKKKSSELRSRTLSMEIAKVSVKVFCGENLTFAIQNKSVFVWGTIGDPKPYFINTLDSPVPIHSFSEAEVKCMGISKEKTIICVGLVNNPQMKFSIFEPPVVQSGTIDALLEYAINGASVHLSHFLTSSKSDRTKIIDDDFTFSFLLSYPSFMTDSEVFKLLTSGSLASKYSLRK